MRAGAMVFVLALAAAVAGCASTVIECNIRQADIYVDGQHRGRGRVRMGAQMFPSRSHVRVEAPDGRVVEKIIDNPYYLQVSFSGVPSAKAAAAAEAWSPQKPAANDPWMTAPYGWDKAHHAASAGAPSKAPKYDGRADAGAAAPDAQPAAP